MQFEELKDFLNAKVVQYHNRAFIENDPIQTPHRFTQKEDIEIAGFLTAIISWGNRKSIIRNSQRMMDALGNSPYDFVMNHQSADLASCENFVHRTFNGLDFIQFIKSLKHIYSNYGGLEKVFIRYTEEDSLQPAISTLKKKFFEIPHTARSRKHFSDPAKGSCAKRINMFLRWMVRNNDAGVDFGIWKKIHPSVLSCPLDVHSGRVARKLGLLQRKQNDAKALMELDASLRALDPQDPVKYDYALFGLGVFEKF